ncbi:hypothetical protein D8M04_04110 [Oceanobacillus piezotolerans]|uniref:Uncharacterized protein n=1 Tax=Oceanobacillus piezotolerans TaxID=2448030 RepID=A0A498DAS7_9BACI|nr:hypothetical protein [Oceanobacillus piezotolerans]RLL48453.1 hypothetical protein D8M04_04110 [Oceanobacillus piezotolerans]
MKNNYIIYNIVVHTVNWFLLGFIGFLAFFLVINISPGPNYDGVKFVYIVTLVLIWSVNYWYQYYKNRKWILPIAGTILFVVIAFLLLGVVVPFLIEIIYF